MAFRFFRRMKIAPGVSLNLSKSGASLSLGPRGAKVTVGPRGVRRTVGIPGTGIYWTEQTAAPGRTASGGRRSRAKSPPPTVRPEDRLTLGFFKRLITPAGEEHFVDGMREHVLGNEAAAYQHFQQAGGLADAEFMAAVLALKQEQFDAAERHLLAARSRAARLGAYFGKYGVQASAALAITPQVAALVAPDPRSILLALAEVHQHQGRPRDAARDLNQLYQRDRDDVVARLSLAELLVEEFGGKQDCQKTVQLAAGIDNASEIHAALLLYKAKALRKLGVLAAARDTLTSTLRRRKGRSDELLRALRYERALVYEQLGEAARARKELEKLYAEAPDYEDVAQRLGLK